LGWAVCSAAWATRCSPPRSGSAAAPNVMRISERGLQVTMEPYSEDPPLGARQPKLRTPRSPLLSTCL
jgi:hypothetical protein